MKRIFALLTALMMCPLVSYSTDLVLTNGTTFNNIEVTENTPLGINFICNGSAGWADFRDMPLNEATAFGYDPVKAAAFEKQLQDNQGSALPDNASPGAYIPQQAITNADNVAQTPENTITINPGDSIPYDTEVSYGCAPQWVIWNGYCYPYNYWHHWYWHNQWVYSNGHYCPAHYYHQHGLWHGSKYYPYKHNLQTRPTQPIRSVQRTNGRSFESRPGGKGLQPRVVERGGERAGGERAGGERAGGERAGGERAGGERAGGERDGGGERGGGGRR